MNYITRIILTVLFALTVTYVANAQYYNPAYTRLPGFDAASCATNEVPTKQADGTWACGSGGGGGSQTPWTSTIDAADNDLTEIGTISSDKNYSANDYLLDFNDTTALGGFGVQCASNDCEDVYIGVDLEADGISDDASIRIFQNTVIDNRIAGFPTFRINASHVIAQQDHGIGWSNSDTDSSTFEAGFFYDGTDTVNLGSAAGTADANLEVANLTIGTGTSTAGTLLFDHDFTNPISIIQAQEGGAGDLFEITFDNAGARHAGITVSSGGTHFATIDLNLGGRVEFVLGGGSELAYSFEPNIAKANTSNGWGWANSSSNATSATLDAFWHDGTDTVNLGSASGTADANLAINSLEVAQAGSATVANIHHGVTSSGMSIDGAGRYYWMHGSQNEAMLDASSTAPKFIVQSDGAFCHSGSTTAGSTAQDCLWYDGTDTYNLGSAQGTADANLEVNGLTVGDTISGSWDLPTDEILILLTDPTTGDGLFSESRFTDGQIISLGLTQNGTSMATGYEFYGSQIRGYVGGIHESYLTNAGLYINQDAAFAWSNNNTNPVTLEVGFFYDGTDTVNLGSAAGTADADLQVDEIQLTDQGTKGTCDSGKAGTIAYEVVANVGTFYGCRQTAASTYAWTALH